MYIYDIFISRYHVMNTLIVLNYVHSEEQTEHELCVVRHALVFDGLLFLIGIYDFVRLETVENDGIPVHAGTHWGEIHVRIDGTYELDLYFAHSDESSDDRSFGSPGSAYTSGSDDDDILHFPTIWQFPAPPPVPVQPTPADLGLDETYPPGDLDVDEDEVY